MALNWSYCAHACPERTNLEASTREEAVYNHFPPPDDWSTFTCFGYLGSAWWRIQQQPIAHKPLTVDQCCCYVLDFLAGVRSGFKKRSRECIEAF